MYSDAQLPQIVAARFNLFANPLKNFAARPHQMQVSSGKPKIQKNYITAVEGQSDRAKRVIL
jgi:hypothetical protein